MNRFMMLVLRCALLTATAFYLAGCAGQPEPLSAADQPAQSCANVQIRVDHAGETIDLSVDGRSVAGANVLLSNVNDVGERIAWVVSGGYSAHLTVYEQPVAPPSGLEHLHVDQTAAGRFPTDLTIVAGPLPHGGIVAGPLPHGGIVAGPAALDGTRVGAALTAGHDRDRFVTRPREEITALVLAGKSCSFAATGSDSLRSF